MIDWNIWIIQRFYVSKNIYYVKKNYILGVLYFLLHYKCSTGKDTDRM